MVAWLLNSRVLNYSHNLKNSEKNIVPPNNETARFVIYEILFVKNSSQTCGYIYIYLYVPYLILYLDAVGENNRFWFAKKTYR